MSPAHSRFLLNLSCFFDCSILVQLGTIGTTGMVWKFESVSYAFKFIKALIKSGKYARALCGPDFGRA